MFFTIEERWNGCFVSCDTSRPVVRDALEAVALNHDLDVLYSNGRRRVFFPMTAAQVRTMLARALRAKRHRDRASALVFEKRAGIVGLVPATAA